ncbi:MAG: LamG domain-containing protein, partial [Candidatus Lokiarchaeota archaeon]
MQIAKNFIGYQKILKRKGINISEIEKLEHMVDRMQKFYSDPIVLWAKKKYSQIEQLSLTQVKKKVKWFFDQSQLPLDLKIEIQNRFNFDYFIKNFMDFASHLNEIIELVPLDEVKDKENEDEEATRMYIKYHYFGEIAKILEVISDPKELFYIKKVRDVELYFAFKVSKYFSRNRNIAKKVELNDGVDDPLDFFLKMVSLKKMVKIYQLEKKINNKTIKKCEKLAYSILKDYDSDLISSAKKVTVWKSQIKKHEENPKKARKSYPLDLKRSFIPLLLGSLMITIGILITVTLQANTTLFFFITPLYINLILFSGFAVIIGYNFIKVRLDSVGKLIVIGLSIMVLLFSCSTSIQSLIWTIFIYPSAYLVIKTFSITYSSKVNPENKMHNLSLYYHKKKTTLLLASFIISFCIFVGFFIFRPQWIYIPSGLILLVTYLFTFQSKTCKRQSINKAKKVIFPGRSNNSAKTLGYRSKYSLKYKHDIKLHSDNSKMQRTAIVITFFLVCLPIILSIPSLVNILCPSIQFAQVPQESRVNGEYDINELDYYANPLFFDELPFNGKFLSRAYIGPNFGETSIMIFKIVPNSTLEGLDKSYNLFSPYMYGPLSNSSLYTNFELNKLKLVPGDYQIYASYSVRNGFSGKISNTVEYQMQLVKDELDVISNRPYLLGDDIEIGAAYTNTTEDGFLITFDGIVINSLNEPLANRNITLFLANGNGWEEITTLMTDEFGKFTHQHLVVDNLLLNAEVKITYEGDELYEMMEYTEYAGIEYAVNGHRFFIDKDGDGLVDWLYSLEDLMHTADLEDYPDSLQFLAHFNEDGGTKTYDEVNKLGGIITEANWTSGKVGKSLIFDQNSYVDFGNVLNNVFGSGSGNEFVVSMWIKPDQLTSSPSSHGVNNVFFSKSMNGGDDNFELGISPDGELELYMNTYPSGETIGTYGSKGTIITGNWLPIVIRYDQGNVDCLIGDTWYYISAQKPEPWDGEINFEDSNASIYIGGQFSGAIDEVAVYNTSLPHSEIEDSLLPYLTLETTVYKQNIVGGWTPITTDGEILNNYIYLKCQKSPEAGYVTSMKFYLYDQLPDLQNPNPSLWNLLTDFTYNAENYSYIANELEFPDSEHWYFISRAVDTYNEIYYDIYDISGNEISFAINHFNTSLEFDYVNRSGRINHLSQVLVNTPELMKGNIEFLNFYVSYMDNLSYLDTFNYSQLESFEWRPYLSALSEWKSQKGLVDGEYEIEVISEVKFNYTNFHNEYYYNYSLGNVTYDCLGPNVDILANSTLIFGETYDNINNYVISSGVNFTDSHFEKLVLEFKYNTPEANWFRYNTFYGDSSPLLFDINILNMRDDKIFFRFIAYDDLGNSKIINTPNMWIMKDLNNHRDFTVDGLEKDYYLIDANTVDLSLRVNPVDNDIDKVIVSSDYEIFELTNKDCEDDHFIFQDNQSGNVNVKFNVSYYNIYNSECT